MTKKALRNFGNFLDYVHGSLLDAKEGKESSFIPIGIEMVRGAMEEARRDLTALGMFEESVQTMNFVEDVIRGGTHYRDAELMVIRLGKNLMTASKEDVKLRKIYKKNPEATWDDLKNHLTQTGQE